MDKISEPYFHYTGSNREGKYSVGVANTDFENEKNVRHVFSQLNCVLLCVYLKLQTSSFTKQHINNDSWDWICN